jgi:hypothetical protein
MLSSALESNVEQGTQDELPSFVVMVIIEFRVFLDLRIIAHHNQKMDVTSRLMTFRQPINPSRRRAIFFHSTRRCRHSASMTKRQQQRQQHAQQQHLYHGKQQQLCFSRYKTVCCNIGSRRMYHRFDNPPTKNQEGQGEETMELGCSETGDNCS